MNMHLLSSQFVLVVFSTPNNKWFWFVRRLHFRWNYHYVKRFQIMSFCLNIFSFFTSKECRRQFSQTCRIWIAFFRLFVVKKKKSLKDLLLTEDLFRESKAACLHVIIAARRRALLGNKIWQKQKSLELYVLWCFACVCVCVCVLTITLTLSHVSAQPSLEVEWQSRNHTRIQFFFFFAQKRKRERKREREGIINSKVKNISCWSLEETECVCARACY
jgi:hypothetical protein